jgi:hypothetical protein
LDYANVVGFHRVDPTWPSGLQVAAKWSWVLPDFPPLDFVVFRDLVADIAGRGGSIAPDGFVALVLGHALKWPPAVHCLRICLRAEPRPWTAAVLLESFWKAVQSVDGLELPRMHRAMSSKGRMHAATGLVVHAQYLHLIEHERESPEAFASGTEPARDLGQFVLHLGKGQSAFRSVPAAWPAATQLVQLWLDRAPRLEAPEDQHTVTESIRTVADTVLQAICDIRRISCTVGDHQAGPLRWPTPGEESGGASGASGASSKSPPGYLAKHFTRAVLLALDELHWGVPWAEVPWTVGDLDRWCPDETGQMRMVHSMPLARAAEVFSLAAPLWVSCWACFAGGLSPGDLQRALSASDRAVVVAFASLARLPRSLDEDPDQFSPVVADVLDKLKKTAKPQSAPAAVSTVPAAATASAVAAEPVAAATVPAAAPEPGPSSPAAPAAVTATARTKARTESKAPELARDRRRRR